jgi:hypothetical protein
MTILYKLIIATVMLGFLWGLHSYDKENAVRKAETAIELRLKTEQQQAVLAAIADTQKANDVIVNKSLETIKERDEQIKTIKRKLASAVDSLQDRPSRSEQHPSNSNIAITCTGRELSREDGEFLAREASEAEKLIYERDYYYNEYENVRIQLNELRLKGNK